MTTRSVITVLVLESEYRGKEATRSAVTDAAAPRLL